MKECSTHPYTTMVEHLTRRIVGSQISNGVKVDRVSLKAGTKLYTKFTLITSAFSE